tara:strand:+ start:3928 stop:5508 length:1581 start_codon:yes stop_codon:yes gene_type:complete
MLIFLSACAEKQLENISTNNINQNPKPQVLKNSSNEVNIKSINKKNIENLGLTKDAEKTNKQRITKTFKSNSISDKDFSNRFLNIENNVKTNKDSISQKNIKKTDQNISQDKSSIIKNGNNITNESNKEKNISTPKDEAILKSIPEILSSKIKVGLLLPLSGSNSELGSAMLNAATMAIFDLSDENFELLPRDTQGTPKGSIEAINDLISNGAEMVLGPVFSNSVKAISPIVESANITVIAFSNDSSISGKNIYLLGFSPEQQIERIISFASSQGIENYAAVVPESAYGKKIINAIETYIPMYGGRLNKIEEYDIKQGDYRDVIKKITDYEDRKKLLIENREKLLVQGDPVALKALERLEEKETMGEVNFEAILIPEGGARLRSIAPLLAFYDVDPRTIKILGTGLWDEPGIGLEPALVGGWFAGPSPEVGKSFRQKYREIYEKDPHRLASLSYDATALAVVLSRNGNEKLINMSILNNSSGFTGVDGLFRFNQEGLAERGLAVLEINKKGFKIIDPSPETFNNLN